MNRMLLGALAALLLVSAGVFWWQGRAETETGLPPPDDADAIEGALDAPVPDVLPSADVAGMRGPAPPASTELSREQKRFSRYDRDRDGRVSRNEMLSTRTAAFRKLDGDGNNLLTFEEWAVATGDKFRGADRNRDLSLSPEEFWRTRPKEAAKAKCSC